jgi:hypothetical protein
MAINQRQTDLRVETNIQGTIVDNDEYVATRAAYEHNQQSQPSDNPWAANYKERLQELYAPESDFEVDPAVLEANKNDLRIRRLTNDHDS